MASADLVKPGMHIVAVGADMEGKNEWDPQIFSNAKIVNDSIAECCARGETRNALIAGVITEENIYAEIGQIIEGEKKGRESDDEITTDVSSLKTKKPYACGQIQKSENEIRQFQKQADFL